MAANALLYLHATLWAALFAIAFALFWQIGRARHWHSKRAFVASLVAAAILATIPVAYFQARLSQAERVPARKIFAQVFGPEPSAGIRTLRARYRTSEKFSHAFLAFDANPAALARLLPAPARPVAARADQRVPLPMSGKPPSWWTAAECEARDVYQFANVRRWDELVVTRCRDPARVFAEAVRAD